MKRRLHSINYIQGQERVRKDTRRLDCVVRSKFGYPVVTSVIAQTPCRWTPHGFQNQHVSQIRPGKHTSAHQPLDQCLLALFLIPTSQGALYFDGQIGYHHVEDKSIVRDQ